MDKLEPKTILAVAAHPDDLEFVCGGSVAHWVRKGARVVYLIVTDGSKGSEDWELAHEELVTRRRKEQREAAKILGVTEVYFLDFVDGELENDLAVRREIVRLIRQIKPDTVVTFDPTYVYDEKLGFVNHPDHRVVGQATLDAIFPFARNNRTFPELLDHGFKSHVVKDILLVNFAAMNFFVDIGGVVSLKLQALAQHKSQLDDTDAIQDEVKRMARSLGSAAGTEYAEGFVRVHVNS